MKRGGERDEVAHAILWLLSDEASYSTGVVHRRRRRTVELRIRNSELQSLARRMIAHSKFPIP